jgi:hypothetical protein
MNNEATPVKMWAVHGIEQWEGHTYLFIYSSYEAAFSKARELKIVKELETYITEFVEGEDLISAPDKSPNRLKL